MPDVVSQIHPKLDGGRGLLRAILEIFSLNICRTVEDVKRYVDQTLMFQESSDSTKPFVVATALSCLEFLIR